MAWNLAPRLLECITLLTIIIYFIFSMICTIFNCLQLLFCVSTVLKCINIDLLQYNMFVILHYSWMHTQVFVLWYWLYEMSFLLLIERTLMAINVVSNVFVRTLQNIASPHILISDSRTCSCCFFSTTNIVCSLYDL